MVVNREPYPISFTDQKSQALVCRYGEEGRQYIMSSDVDLSGLTVSLQIVKPDNTFVISYGEVIEPEEGDPYIRITIPLQATVVKGLAHYSIFVSDTADPDFVVYSAEGDLWVDDHLITDDMIESAAEVYGLRFPQDFLTVENLVDIVNYVKAEIENQLLPEALPSERGFYLRASQDTGDPEWSPIDMPYPGYGPSDAGKSLTINADGTGVEWKSSEHIYSTSEHIVGKWIDGSTIYERTFDRHTNPVAMSAYGWHTFAEISEPIYIIDSMGIVVDNGAISANYPIIANYDNGYLYIMHLRYGVTDAMGYVTIRYIKQ